MFTCLGILRGHIRRAFCFKLLCVSSSALVLETSITCLCWKDNTGQRAGLQGSGMRFRGFGGGEGVNRAIELGEDDGACSGKKPRNIDYDCSLPSMEGQACPVRKN